LQYSYWTLFDQYVDPANEGNAALLGELNAKLIGMNDLGTRIYNGRAVTGNFAQSGDLEHAPGSSVPGTPYLMLFSADGHGRWLVALGNPDAASTIVTTVGGIGRGLNDRLFEDLSNNDAMYGAILKAGGTTASVAAIIWIGYDAPTTTTILGIHDVPSQWPSLDAAVAGAPALEHFQKGIVAGHTTAPHVTVIGHSYGTDVVAETTLNNHKLVADDIILIASPGVPVMTAAELAKNSITSSVKAGGTRVWASVTGHDYLTLFAHPLGTWPIPSAFGASDFASDPNGDHGGYWQEPGLSNMANIVLARYQQVTPFTTPILSPSAGPTAVKPSAT
jgi:hypothetical protein